MAFKDILVTLTSYPDPTPVSVLDDAVSIAATLGAHLAAVSCEVHVQVPGHFLAGSIANIPGIIAGEGALLFASSHRFAESAADIRIAPFGSESSIIMTSGLVALMEKNKLKRLPVMRGETLVGIVSRSNLLQAVASLARQIPDPTADDDHIRNQCARQERLGTVLQRTGRRGTREGELGQPFPHSKPIRQ